MAAQDYDLKTLLDVARWEPVQDQLAALTRTAIITIDYKGIPISKHSMRTAFCTVIRENPVTCKRCYRCDALAGLEAVRRNEPFIYLCHCGIVDVAVPIMVGEQYLGAVMFGQVRLPDGDRDGQVSRLVNEISSFRAEEQDARAELMQKYMELPEMEYSRIVEIANLINSVVRYIVGRVVQSRSDRMAYEWVMRSSLPPQLDWQQEAAHETEPGTPAEERIPVAEDSPVYPALAYLFSHRGEMLRMSQMAELCHLSASYFSKLFLRELGENFTDYVKRQKVRWAKEMLRGTSKSVTEISEELGFLDSSYFIKVFKAFEGITPLAYRQERYYT
ncbi:MAG: PocR ligand-binding domain-containing protein [Oscillospiraceae bacterium]|nr:PocR ligand-binding domain-containing protein [Oscillospiraceae bacterium]